MQTARIPLDPHLVSLTADVAGFAAAARLGLDGEVPACPGWQVATVVNHLGRVHRWVTEIVRTEAREQPPFPARPDEITVDWFESGAAELIEVLKSSGPELEVWTLAGDIRPCAFWFRRMAVETALHRWDLQDAYGQPDAIDTGTAIAGLREIDEFYLRRAGGFDGSLDVVVGEGMELTVGDGERSVTLAGTASDLLLFLWRRVDRARIEVSGDLAVLEDWMELGIP